MTHNPMLTKINAMNRGVRKSAQKGFTLIELVIAVIVVGLLAIVASKQFGTGIASGSKASAIYETASKFAGNWSVLTTQVGTSSAITGSVIPNATACGGAACVPLDILIVGSSAVATAYTTPYAQAGITPLTDSAQGSNGTYTVAGFGVSLTGGGTLPLTVSFTNVPDDVTQILVTKYGSGVTTLASSDSTNGVIQYSTATANTRTVKIIKQM